MHNNIEELFAANLNCCEKNRVAKENGKRFELLSNEAFTKLKIDGCVITSQNLEKCDFCIYRHSNNDFYFIELKGKAIEKAFNQIVNTIQYFDSNLIKIPKQNRIGIIISSKVPAGTRENNLKQKFAKEYGKVLEVKNRELKYRPI